MRDGIKLGPRAAVFVAVLLAASAVGILTPTLSNMVSKDVQVTGFAVSLTVDGIPGTVSPGDVFRVKATMANNGNRPVPAVLRMEVRSSNLGDWTLSVAFSEQFVAYGGGAQDGFLVEVHPQSRGSFQFKLWVERPDGLGIPHHPYTCGPL